MIRTILTAETNTLMLMIPDNLVGKKIEVIAFEIEDIDSIKIREKIKPSQMRGFLSKDSAKKMQTYIDQSRNEWDS